MSVPFTVLFVFAAYLLNVIEGTKIRSSEYIPLSEFGMASIIYIPFAFVCYVVLFLPLTIIVNKLITSLALKSIIFACVGGILGSFAFNGFYSTPYISEYLLNISSAIILFSVAGLLYCLVESAVRQNIKFI